MKTESRLPLLTANAISISFLQGGDTESFGQSGKMNSNVHLHHRTDSNKEPAASRVVQSSAQASSGGQVTSSQLCPL